MTPFRNRLERLIFGDLPTTLGLTPKWKKKSSKRSIAILAREVKNEASEEASKSATNPKKRLSKKLKKSHTYRADLGQDRLELAIGQAEDPINPNRFDLYEIYRQIEDDLHLMSQIRTAFFKVVGEPYAIVDPATLEIDAELTKLVQKEWFEDVSTYKLASEFYGHSLTEFGQMVPDPDFNDELVFQEVSLFPREHVSPEKGLILISPFDTDGLPYREPPFNRWLLEAGKHNDLGVLKAAAKYSIYKFFSLSDWSRSSEKWADPLLVLQSSSDDEEENDEKARFAENFGKNSWMLADIEDKVELLSRKEGASAHLIYKDFIDILDQQNSKGVNGQIATADEKSFVGSAEVQERILNDYTATRLRRLFYYHNQYTLPFLINANGGNSAYRYLEGKIWIPLRYLATTTELKPENEDQGGDPGKKLPSNYRYRMPSLMRSTPSMPGRVLIMR